MARSSRSYRMAACVGLVGLVGLGAGCSPLRETVIPNYPLPTLDPVRASASAPPPVVPPTAHATRPPASGVVQAQATLPATTPPAPPLAPDVNALVQSAVAGNPRLARANALVEVARGRVLQAGLW